MTRIAGLFRTRTFAAALLGAAPLGLLATPASAQPVVQALPDPAAARLSEALRTLARDPQYLPALIDAGQASLALDDVGAALGFFRRAEAISPSDGRIKAGLAAVMTRQGQPLEALRLFGEAEQAGEPMQLHAAERGLAYDLIGDNARAQEQYRVSLAFAPDPEVTRRLALSQAIAGDQRGSEATLLPLLQRTDLAAYRTRAFALAILGRSDEAVSIAETMLPDTISSRISPYLRYMPRLTRAQQAAAANLGTFPRAAEIGRDDPALAAYAPQAGAPPPAARGADARLVPAGEPLGPPREESAIPRRPEIAVQDSPPPAAVAVPPPSAPPPSAPPVAEAAPPPEPVAVLVAASPPPAEAEVPGPSISLAAQDAAPVAVAPPEERDLSQAFSEFSLPAGPPPPAAGAVDITQIQPKREVAKVEPPKPAPPPKPVIPSRHWVQVATGRDVGALAFDWRRLKRSAGGLLDKAAPHTAKWGQTNRLVVGPFGSAREADALVAKLKEKQVDSFRFTSDQGEEVKPLG